MFSHLIKASESLTSAMQVLAEMSKKDQSIAIKTMAPHINNEIITEAKVIDLELHQADQAAMKAKAIETATKVGQFFGKGSRFIGTAVGTTARTAVEVTKAIGTPLVQGVKEGYSTK